MFLALLPYLAFFSIALPDSMLGVARPTMRISFQQPISAVGVVPPLGVAATLASTASSGYLLNRIGLGRLLVASSLLSAVELVVSAASPTMGLFLVSVVLLGLSGTATAAMLLFGFSTAPMYPLLVPTTAERTSAAVADRMIGFQAAASALGAAVFPSLMGLAMGVSARALGLAIAPLCLTAALLHIAMQMQRRR
jgi:MFS family permease